MLCVTKIISSIALFYIIIYSMRTQHLNPTRVFSIPCIFIEHNSLHMHMHYAHTDSVYSIRFTYMSTVKRQNKIFHEYSLKYSSKFNDKRSIE